MAKWYGILQPSAEIPQVEYYIVYGKIGSALCACISQFSFSLFLDYIFESFPNQISTKFQKLQISTSSTIGLIGEICLKVPHHAATQWSNGQPFKFSVLKTIANIEIRTRISLIQQRCSNNLICYAYDILHQS